MGRYDKIRVYHQGEWRQPARMRIYSNGSWIDLGENGSNIKKSLNVKYDNRFVRATLDRTVVEVPGESYVGGDGFRLLPKNGYCYCPNSNYTNTTWFFRATIRKVKDGEQRVFTTYNATGSNTCNLDIDWLSDGRLRVSIRSSYGNSKWQSVTTSNSVGANQWVYLNVTCNKGATRMSVNFNGVTTSGYMIQTWNISNADNHVGSSGIQFKDTLEIQGSKYPHASCYKKLNMNQISGSNSDYESVERVDTSSTEIRWT